MVRDWANKEAAATRFFGTEKLLSPHDRDTIEANNLKLHLQCCFGNFWMNFKNCCSEMLKISIFLTFGSSKCFCHDPPELYRDQLKF